MAVTVAPSPTFADEPSWSFSGAGWGHGVGMSQYGARQMAEDGYSARGILAHYYTGTTYDTVPDSAVLAVNLLDDAASATMTTRALAAGGGAVSVSAGTTTIQGLAGAALSAVPATDGSGVTVTCRTCVPTTAVTGASVTITWDDDRTLLTLDGRSYRDGRVSIARSGSTLDVVAHVRIHDEYLDYLAEMPWSWPAEALRAQAAAARGYALAAHARGVQAACGCHVYDTSASQVFAGYPGERDLPYWPRWKAAVRAADDPARGYVVRYEGRIIQAFYSSSSGGRTQNNEDVWGGSPLPYLRSVNDPWSLASANPRRDWTAVRERSLVAAAFGLEDVNRLDLSHRAASGAVLSAVATSSTGATKAITGEQLRTRLGLNSTYVVRRAARYGGADRYTTAAAVASAIPVGASAVVIASGQPGSLVDATVAGPLAGAVAGPVLLTRAHAVPAATLGELDRRGESVRKAYVIGGASVIGEPVVRALRDRGLVVERLGGADRYETASVVAAAAARERKVTGVVVAEGKALADAVGASGPAAALSLPILLTPSTNLHPSTAASLTALDPSAVYIVGGGVGDGVVQALRSRHDTVRRLSGSDRYATAAAIARFFAPQMARHDAVAISSGLDANLIDALSAGPLGQPMLFVRPTSVPAVTRAAVQGLSQANRVVAVGSGAAVSDSVLVTIRRS